MPDRFGVSSNGGGDDGLRACHSFENHIGKAFRFRRAYVDIQRREDFFRGRIGSQQLDLRAKSTRFNLANDGRLSSVICSGKNEPGLRMFLQQDGSHFHEVALPLAGTKVCDLPENNLVSRPTYLTPKVG